MRLAAESIEGEGTAFAKAWKGHGEGPSDHAFLMLGIRDSRRVVLKPSVSLLEIYFFLL